MPVIESSLFEIFVRFPDYKEAAKKLFHESKEFKTICEDYSQCSAAVRYWSHSSQDSAFARKQEYTALLQELEEELLKTLKDTVQREQQERY
jgi:hypothetical protein